METTLTPQFDHARSFYGKAKVIINGSEAMLRSYTSDVAKISKDKYGQRQALVYDTYSRTTLRHIKEFLRQNGFRADNLAQIVKDYTQGGAQ